MYRVIITPLAHIDEEEAYIWYERKLIGLGDDFLTSLEDAYRKISKNQLGGVFVHLLSSLASLLFDMLSEAHVEMANERDLQSRCNIKNQKFFFISSSGCASLNIHEQLPKKFPSIKDVQMTRCYRKCFTLAYNSARYSKKKIANNCKKVNCTNNFLRYGTDIKGTIAHLLENSRKIANT